MRRFPVITLLVILFCTAANAQGILADFGPEVDSLQVRLERRTGVKTKLSLGKILKRGSLLDFYFTRNIGDYPWHEKDMAWLKGELSSNFPEGYGSYRLGEVFCERVDLQSMITPVTGNDGKAADFRLRSPEPSGEVFVTKIGGRTFPRGLSGRNIALWQSHGRYFDEGTGMWMWQRAPLHRTVEDLLSQSFVVPFLIPMLENAGAYVMTPRERDIQIREIITDNDPSFTDERPFPMRTAGRYSETGSWTDAGEGFADSKPAYTGNDNPFTMGSARQASCVRGKTPGSTARWTPTIQERGSYAVYVSYRSLPNSSTCARYTIRHMGGTSEFSVNQKIGGGTWVYLGTFEFDEGADGCVTLDNSTPSGGRFADGSVVTADAVKIGGGVGKIARGRKGCPESDYTTSALASYMEGALYWMQWAGVDSTITRRWDGDYTQDFASRGAWTESLTKDKGIPVDLSFALHTDAGSTPNDSIVGTLSIYTLREDGQTKLSDGRSRMVCRTFADMVQTQVCGDIRSGFEPLWTRRELWDRSYSESRTTKVPALLLEMLSHQNFADMKLAHDPTFKFTASRAIYKGILKYLSAQYGVPYVVQPLPVHDFSVSLSGSDSAILCWKETADEGEPTASPTGFILQTRLDDGAFDEGRTVKTTGKGLFRTEVDIKPGHLYSFRIIAFNDGGLSFPSEVLCAGRVTSAPKEALVVNNFTRLAAPVWFDTPQYAGFIASEDSGVPYIRDISYAGENYELRRDREWVNNSNPGFGATWTDKAGTIVGGNTFDFTSIHARALMDAGFNVSSASGEAFSEGSCAGCSTVDLLCGKQLRTMVGRGAVPDRYEVYPLPLQNAIREFLQDEGHHMVISGAYVATDLWECIYPTSIDSLKRASGIEFAHSVLGIDWVTSHGSRTGEVSGTLNGTPVRFHIPNTPGGPVYSVENPDGIKAAKGSDAQVLLRYADTGVPAAVRSERVTMFGFPLECISDRSLLQTLLTL